MPSDSRPGEQQVMLVSETLWYMMHSLIVTTGIGTLIKLTPVILSTSVIGGFVLVVTLLRAIVNKGELRYFRRLKPTAMNTVMSVVGSMFLYGIGPAIMPLSVMRSHLNLGPTIFGFVWTVSFGASVGHWLNLLPTNVRNEIWTADEMLELKESMKDVKNNLERIVIRTKKKQAHLLLDETDKDMEDVDVQQTNSSSITDLSIDEAEGGMDRGSPMGNSSWKTHTTEGARLPPKDGQSRLEDGAENEDEKRIRKQIAVTAKRRSSIIESIRNFVPRPMLKHDALLEDLAAPIFLNNLLEGAATMSIEEVNEVIASAVDEDFAVKLIEGMPDDDNDHFPALLIGALIKYLRKEDKRNNETSGLARTIISAFFEVGDEASDFVLAILFLVDSGDLKWAATLMFVFMGLNRFIGVLLAFLFKEPRLRVIEALIGIRSVTDTYRILTQGSEMMSGTISLIQCRVATLATGLVCESLPQMVLQLSIVMAEMKSGTVDQGILAAQITSVLASCLSIGLSFASLTIDVCRSSKINHPSPFVFTYGMSSSILIAMVSLFVYIPDASMKVLFIVLSVMYFLVVIVFLVTMDENIFTFLFSTTNWKETLRDELWDSPLHGSPIYGIPELVGDHDANHAAHIDAYPSCYLPWEKITTWLLSKKAAFLESPPLWMTPEWFDKLTPEVKRNVWPEPGELEELLTKVKEVCAKAKEQ
eukprot:g3005.t1